MPSTEQCLEQPGDEHRIADVMDVKLVETQHPAIAQLFIEGDFQRIGLIAMTEHSLVQLRKKLMKMQALFFRDGKGLEKPVEQPALAATHGAVQVKAGERFCRGAQQRCGVLRHAVDDALLAMAEGVALGVGLAVEVVVDDSTGRGVTGGCSRCLAEQAA